MESFYFYKITQHGSPHIYIGKTTNPKCRLATHKSNVIAGMRKYRLYETIRENGGWDNGWKFDIIETHDMTREEAMAKEEELCHKYVPDLNVRLPNSGNYNREYYLRNREAIKVNARNKYIKTKTEWKTKQKTQQEMKKIHLRKVRKTGKVPTPLSCEKHNILQEEIQTALDDGGW